MKQRIRLSWEGFAAAIFGVSPPTCCYFGMKTNQSPFFSFSPRSLSPLQCPLILRDKNRQRPTRECSPQTAACPDSEKDTDVHSREIEKGKAGSRGEKGQRGVAGFMGEESEKDGLAE